jgi:cyclophilin family peptidyl-prolyl cis-trans isomerase
MKEKTPLLIIVASILAVSVIVILLNNSSNNVTNSSTSEPVAEQAQPANETQPTKEVTPMPVVQNNSNKKSYAQPFNMQLADGVNYRAELTTTMGVIKIDLFEKDAPKTVNNFVSLAKDGFYDGLIFHRVIEDFMIQGGDPLGVGMGGPGYQFEDEFNSQKLVKGSLAMANSGPNTNGSQFFIVTATETPWLDGKHTNFGIVTEGLEVAEAISKVDKDSSDKPKTPVVLEKVVIVEE